MPWFTPKTDFLNGDVLTATQMNNIGFDLAYLYDMDAGYTTTATAGGTTTLTVSSTTAQFFTGTANQTVQMPVTSTLTLGEYWYIHNNSTGVLTVNSSGGNLIVSIQPGHTWQLTCVLTSGTTAASWDADFGGSTSITGTGAIVMANDAAMNYPLLKTPEEFWTISATAATGTIAYDVLTQAVLYYTTNASANFTLNFRGSATATLNSILAVGNSVTVMFMNTNGTTAYYPTAFQIDGTSVTPRWSGGTAPTSGNASSVDAYSFTIVKTAATPTYTVFAGQVRF